VHVACPVPVTRPKDENENELTLSACDVALRVTQCGEWCSLRDDLPDYVLKASILSEAELPSAPELPEFAMVGRAERFGS